MDSVDIEMLAALGRRLMDNARHQQASEVFLQLVYTHEHCDEEIFHLLMESCILAGNDDRAIWACHRAVEVFPSSLSSRHLLINTLLVCQRCDDAVVAATAALRVFPCCEALMSLRGDCHYKAGRYRLAVADFHRAVEMTREREGLSSCLNNALKVWKRDSPI